MTDEKHEPEEAEDLGDGRLLPAREVMSLLGTGGGMGSMIPAIGPEQGVPAPAPAPAAGGLADGAAAHAQDAAAGQSSDHPVVSDQPQSLASTSDKSASSTT